jgi:4-diphosphocytidyl-2-C-methyl-D-erythritol kinase
MSVSAPSFAKINLGLRIGPLRPDGFHELRTVYQTIALHDFVRVSVGRGSGIEIRCDDPRVPCDNSNTCHKIAGRAIEALKLRGRVVIEIEKRLPVQGGLGGASGNAVAALLALEAATKKQLSPADRLRIAAEVGSDLPLFLIGGTVLGVGRGEEVYPLPDLNPTPCVIALPQIAVSTPEAFRDWDRLCGAGALAREQGLGEGTASRRAELPSTNSSHSEPALAGEESANRRGKAGSSSHSLLGMTSLKNDSQLTSLAASDRMLKSSREISAWLAAAEGGRRSGVSARGGGRAESPLLDLVRTGIENDFEKVVFPQHPELRQVKSVLERCGAQYASLSGSGSAVYGLFASRQKAAAAVKKLARQGTRAVVTSTLTRRQYWKKLPVSSF